MKDLHRRLSEDWGAADEPVGILVVKQSELPLFVSSDDERTWQHIPDSAWRPIIHLGAAYSLHFAEIADPVVGALLEPPQVESLLHELSFLLGFIQDRALGAAVGILMTEARKALASPDLRLVISPP